MCGIDPRRLTGMTMDDGRCDRVYNLAMPLATTADIYHATIHGLDRPPRLLVYGITATDLNEGRADRIGPEHLMTPLDLAIWCRERPDRAFWALGIYGESRLSKGCHLYRYRDGIRRWAMTQLELNDPSSLTDEQRFDLGKARMQDHAFRRCAGFLDHPLNPADRLDWQESTGRIPARFSFLDRYRIVTYRRYLDRLIDWSEQHAVPLVLVDLPVPPLLDRQLHPQEYAVYRAMLAEYEQQGRVRVLHADHDRLGLTNADYSDLIHLNVTGSRILSDWLRAKLDHPLPTL
jgi:hypothetical protein